MTKQDIYAMKPGKENKNPAYYRITTPEPTTSPVGVEDSPERNQLIRNRGLRQQDVMHYRSRVNPRPPSKVTKLQIEKVKESSKTPKKLKKHIHRHKVANRDNLGYGLVLSIIKAKCSLQKKPHKTTAPTSKIIEALDLHITAPRK
jgi:hypothetical protein